MNRPLTEEELFCLQGTRSYKQYHEMRKGFEDGHCQFCDLDRSFNQVVWEDEHVFAWHVPEAYLRKELRLHMLIVPKRHVRFEADLSDSEALSVHTAKRMMRDLSGYQGGLVHAREGDMHLNAGTVPHLHYNIFEPNQSGEVRVPVFKLPKDRKMNEYRAQLYARLYEGGVTPESFKKDLEEMEMDEETYIAKKFNFQGAGE